MSNTKCSGRRSRQSTRLSSAPVAAALTSVPMPPVLGGGEARWVLRRAVASGEDAANSTRLLLLLLPLATDDRPPPPPPPLPLASEVPDTAAAAAADDDAEGASPLVSSTPEPFMVLPMSGWDLLPAAAAPAEGVEPLIRGLAAEKRWRLSSVSVGMLRRFTPPLRYASGLRMPDLALGVRAPSERSRADDDMGAPLPPFPSFLAEPAAPPPPPPPPKPRGWT